VSSYQRLIILFLFFTTFSLASGSNEKAFDKEDLYIVFAIEYEKIGQINAARDLYLKLFEKTNKSEYLVKYLKVSLSIKKFEDVKYVAAKYLDKTLDDYEEILRIYCVALLNLKEYDKALEVGQSLIKQFDSAINYDVVANVHFVKKNYNKAKEYFESAYSLSKNPTSLFNLVNVLYAYLNQKEEAIAYLETHVRLYGCDYIVCTKLLSFYQEQNDIDGAISILKRSYFQFKKEGRPEVVEKLYRVLIAYLEKKDINEAIAFLEQNNVDDLQLLALYRRSNQSLKALNLVRKLYKQSGNIDLLAQIAILEFETAPNKKKVLKKVIRKFEDVLIVLDNHVYQNYLGYILIDFDLDIKKGLKLVNQALEKAPNNAAYIDSLAWGQYKLDDCKNAYKNMKKVVDEVGTNDDEIKKHWTKIKECRK
jgi:tetratricopeptide (TPR) repeat protein